MVIKKGPELKREEAFYPGGSHTNGGSWIFANYLFYFHHYLAEPTSMNLAMPKDTDKPDEVNKVKESGSLTLMLGKG